MIKRSLVICGRKVEFEVHLDVVGPGMSIDCPGVPVFHADNLDSACETIRSVLGETFCNQDRHAI